MKPFSILMSLLLCLSFTAQADDIDTVINTLDSDAYKIPKATNQSNQSIFKKYCTGNAYGYSKPYPKYENALVKNAAKILRKTQNDADARLLEMFKENWKGTIEQISGSLDQLASSSNEVLQKLSKNLKDSLNVEATGFTSQQKKWYETMVDASFVDIKKGFAGLKAATTEFKGVDYNKVKDLVNQFRSQLQGDLKPVDYEKLKTLSASFETEFKAYQGQIDLPELIAAFKIIKAKFNELTSEDMEFKWAIESVDWALTELEKDPPNLEDAQYMTGDVISFFTDEYYAKYFEDASEEVLKASKVVMKHDMAFNADSNLKMIDNLAERIDQFKNGEIELYQVRYAAEDIQRNLIPFIEVSKDAQFVANAKAFSAETGAFGGEGLMNNVSIVKKLLADPDSSNDLNAVSRISSWEYDINRMKELLSENTLNQYGVLLAESRKVEQDQVKDTLDQVIELAATATAENFMEEASWQVRNLAETFNDLKAGLSATSQKSVAAFKKVSDDFSVLSELKYQMSSEFELKKAGHYYFYGAVKRLYKVNSGNQPYGRLANTFLVQLCGEFRDRATMIEAKLKWIQRLYTLPKEQNTTSIDFKKNVWAQMSAEDYYPYLEVTRSLWEARKASGDAYVTIGKYDTIDTPIEGPTVCETKYIFEKYVKKGVHFDNLESYTTDYENNYRSLCSQADQEDYYDFRGDSNFKHYSPESNAMIWKATSIARSCSSVSRAKSSVSGEANNYSDQDCKDYFTRPFYYRYNAARSALATGLVYDSVHDSSFDSQGDAPVTVFSHLKPQYAPMSYETETSAGETFAFAKEWLALQQWNTSDIGFNDFTGLGSENPNAELAYERLRGSVDRHTNWYSAGYNDGNGVVKDQAFSPFVASSYVMEASDAFTTCGITVQCPPDGLKRWMFVFRVKPQNWYNPQRIIDNEQVDFDKMWFDETSFGDSGLANGESAWDRMGTAMEEELDSILYLINVSGGGFHGEFEEEHMDH